MKTVWFIDDDQEMINAISLMMKLLGYQFESFFNAPDAAKALLEEDPPDLLILDIHMPQVSGMDLLEFIRLRPEFDKLPVIMLSTDAADVQVDEALDLGADAYVFKPVTIEELEAAIKKANARRK